MKKKTETIFGVLFTVVAIMILYSSFGQTDRMEKKRKKELKEYPNIEKNSIEYKGIIAYSHLSKGMVGARSVMLNNRQKFLVSADTRNEKYNKKSMMEFIQIGYSIYRSPSSDTVYICRDNMIYYFLVGRSIN